MLPIDSVDFCNLIDLKQSNVCFFVIIVFFSFLVTTTTVHIAIINKEELMLRRIDSEVVFCQHAWMIKYAFISLFCFITLAGCASPPQGPMSADDLGFDVREYVAITDTKSGASANWGDVMSSVAEAEVVLLGELHDHAVAHAVQLAIAKDVLERWPASVVAFEMLERDEQVLVDDYMDDFIDAKTFAALTRSTSWAGEGSWGAWYQPIIDVAKESKGGVVAANAPRRYVRIARIEGYEKIDELPDSRKVFVHYPDELSSGRYRQRFWELAFHNENEEEQEEIDVTNIDPDDPMLPVFRSQQVWDSTMAESVALQNPTVDKKVLLLVGQFHIEYDGGIVQELKKMLPGVNILSISIQKEVPEEDWSGSPKIADFMFVGEDPKR
ncbi:MAG: ChaN family lipoprotein [Phycisphaerae bacterium]|nr:ChaN family lipoprotein [Phycisphaerae bacterium]